MKAIRGGRPLSVAEFRAQLGQATRLEHIGVLLGAGASVNAGGSLVSDIWNTFRNDFSESAEWLTERGLVSLHSSGQPNLEETFNWLEIALAELDRTNPRGRIRKQLIQCFSDLRRSVIKGALLADELWQPDLESESPTLKLKLHRDLLIRLTATRKPGQLAPWIFTTNYDLSVEWAAESLGLRYINGFAGIHNRSFAPANFDLAYRNVLARGEARFGNYHVYISKLHGSLNWLLQGKAFVRELPASEVRPVLDQFLTNPSEPWPGLLVFPSAAKYLQTIGFVFGELLRRFTEFLARPHTCLIVCGYSFGDDHINRVLASALQNPTLQLIIYLPEIDISHEPELIRTGNNWVNTLFASQHPQLTWVGNDSNAYFEALVKDLPEPALIDDTLEHTRRLLLRLFDRIHDVPMQKDDTTADVEAAATEERKGDI